MSDAWDKWERVYSRLLDRKLKIEEQLEEVEGDISVLESERDELTEIVEEARRAEKKLQQVDANLRKQKAKLKTLESQWDAIDKEDQQMADREPEK